MGEITSSYIFPHPPIIVPEVGKGSESGAGNTINSVKTAAEDIKNDKPTTIILTTPHGPVFQDYIYVAVHERLEGDLGRFGAKGVKMSFENNTELVEGILHHAKSEGIFAGGLEQSLFKRFGMTRELDHGALVPLYFVKNVYSVFKLVHISIAGLPFLDLYKFGMCISKAVQESHERVVFLASGDLSHRLTKDAPYGFNEKGKLFDELLVKSLKNADVENLLDIDESLCESAGECGLRSFIMMFGAFDGCKIEPHVYSYEGPFGVGYSVARFTNEKIDNNREIFKKMIGVKTEKMKQIRAAEDEYVALARSALETYVREEKIIDVPEAIEKQMLENKAGTFVSIKKHGQLRGCIGTTGPTRRNIAEEIINNAISSGTQDPRFDPVEVDELDDLVYSVDVLKEPEKIEFMDELDVARYGVIVKAGARSGLLLPNLEGVDTPYEQVSIALKKAGIKPSEKYTMQRFEVIRHK